MITYDAPRARAAVQFLAESPYHTQHVRRLNAAVVRPRSQPFKGDAEPLNELLVIGRQSRAAMDNLVEVAALRRDTRNDYQREYMAAKRQRDRKVIHLTRLLERRKIPVDMKVRVLRNQYEVWNKERDQFLASLGPVSWSERNTRLRDFWVRKESEIDQLIAEAAKTGSIKP